MNGICIFFGVLFLVTGLVFACGKGHCHLRAWKQMPPDEKETIDILPLCRNIGGMIALSAIPFLIRGLFIENTSLLFVCLMGGWLILAGCDVHYINKHKRYQKG